MDEKMKISIDMNKEKITVYSGKHNVGELEFIIDETQIIIGSITIIKDKNFQGYGNLLINTIKGIAQHHNCPISVISYPNKVIFYLKMGFFSMDKLIPSFIYNGIKVNIKNIDKSRPITNQIGEVDMLWIPPSLKEVDVYL
jgi:hypothetical protein